MTPVFGALPADWGLARLDRLASVNARIGWKALTAAEYVDEGYVFISTPNIKSDTIDWANVNYISSYRYEESPELKLALGDVLLVKDGSTLGITNVVRQLPRPATVNGSIAVLRTHLLEPRYLRYALASSNMQTHIQLVRDGMGVPHLFQRDIRRFPIPVPPREEQRRIADFLDAQVALLNQAMTQRDVHAALLEERRDACVEAMTSGGTERRRLATGSQWYPQLPEGWSARAVKHLASKIGSGKTPSGGANSYLEAGVALLRSQNVHNDGLRLSDVAWIDEATDAEMAATRVQAEDVLFNITGASLGRCTVVPPNLPRANVNQHVCIVRCRQAADPSYVAYALTSPAVAQQVRVAQVGGNREGLNFEQLGNLQVALPESRATQMAVRQQLDEQLAANRLLQNLCARQQDLLRERKQTLITAAVTGQLDVTTARSVA